jgi:hypothetical protein
VKSKDGGDVYLEPNLQHQLTVLCILDSRTFEDSGKVQPSQQIVWWAFVAVSSA